MRTTRGRKENNNNNNTFKAAGAGGSKSNVTCIRSVGDAQYRIYPALTCTLCAYSVCLPCYVKYTRSSKNPKRLENEEEQRALEESLHEGYEGACHKCKSGVLELEERPLIPWVCGGMFGEDWRKSDSTFHSQAIAKYHENRVIRAARMEKKNVIYAEFNQCVFPTPPSTDNTQRTASFPIPSVHYSRGACGVEGGIVRYTVTNEGPKQSCVWCLVSSSKRNEDRQYGGPGGRMGTQTIVPVVRWEVPPTLPGIPADEFELEVPTGMWGYDVGLEDDGDDNDIGAKSEIPRRVHQLALYRESELFRVDEEDDIATSNTVGKKKALRSTTDEIVRQQSTHRMSLAPTRVATAQPNTPLHTESKTREKTSKPAVRGPLMVLTILHPAPALQRQQVRGSKRDREVDDAEMEANGTPSATTKSPPTDMALAVDNLLHGRNVACFGYGSKVDFLRGVALSSCFASLPVHEVYCFNTPTSYNHNQHHFTEMQERHAMLLAGMGKLTEGRNKVGQAKLPNGLNITTSHQANMGLVLRSVEDEIKLLAAQHEEQAEANGRMWVDKGVLFGGQRLPHYPAPQQRSAADEDTMPPPSFTPSRRQPSDQAQATSTPRTYIRPSDRDDEAATRLDVSEAFSPAPKAPSTPKPLLPESPVITAFNTTLATTGSGDAFGGVEQKSVVRRLDMQVDQPTTSTTPDQHHEEQGAVVAEEIDHDNDADDDDDSNHDDDGDVDGEESHIEEEGQQHVSGSHDDDDDDDDSSISLKPDADDAEESVNEDAGTHEALASSHQEDVYADDDDEGSHVATSSTPSSSTDEEDVEEEEEEDDEETADEENGETGTIDKIEEKVTEVQEETTPTTTENVTEQKQVEESALLPPPPPPPGDDLLPPKAPLSASPSSRKLFNDAIARAPSASLAALTPSKVRPSSKKRVQAEKTFDLMDPLNAGGGWARSVSFSYVSKLEPEYTTNSNDNDAEEGDMDMDMDDTARAPGEVEAMVSCRPRHHRVNPAVSAALLLNCYPTSSWELCRGAVGTAYAPLSSMGKRYFHPAPFRQILVLHGVDSLDAANLQHLERLIATCNTSSSNPLCCELLILCSVDNPNWLAGSSSTAPSGAVGTAGQGGGAVSGARVGKASSYNAYYTATGRNTTASLYNSTHTPSTLSPATNAAALSFANKCKFSSVHLTTKEYAFMPFIQEAAHITDLALLMDASRASGSVNTGGGAAGIPTGLRPGSLVLGGDLEEDEGGVDDGVEFLSDAVTESDDDDDDEHPTIKNSSAAASHRQPAGRRNDNNTRSNLGVRTTGGAANIFDSTSSAMDTIERVLVSVPETFRMVFRHILLLQEETVAANPVLTGKKAAAAASIAEEDEGMIDAGPPKAGDVFDQVSSGNSEAELDIKSNIKMHSIPINSIAPYVERSANNTILLSTARLRSVIAELTSNSLAVYDDATHSIFIPHHRRVMKVLAMVDRRSKGG